MSQIDDTETLDIFQSVFAGSNAFIYRCRNDSDYTMHFMAGCVEEITGYGAEQLIGNRDASFVGITHPEDQQLAFDQVDAAIAAGGPWDMVYRLVRRDGGIAWIRERGSAVFDAGGELQYLQGLIADAGAEVGLREEIRDTAQQTEAANREILSLAGKISESVRQLSFLSINARIEAARAGEIGRGFAVVATEINALVEENAIWADEIQSKMGGARRYSR